VRMKPIESAAAMHTKTIQFKIRRRNWKRHSIGLYHWTYEIIIEAATVEKPFKIQRRSSRAMRNRVRILKFSTTSKPRDYSSIRFDSVVVSIMS
jgi:hypothetical protein